MKVRSVPQRGRGLLNECTGALMLKFFCCWPLILLAFAGSTAAGENTFSIFLPARTVSLEEVSNIDMSALKLKSNPIISDEDIISYSRSSHLIKLSAPAYDRFMNLESGTIFMVCVGKKPVYWGVIWNELLSAAWEGLTIVKPIKSARHEIRIQRGYPSEEYCGVKDPRSNEQIIMALKKSNKLIGE